MQETMFASMKPIWNGRHSTYLPSADSFIASFIAMKALASVAFGAESLGFRDHLALEILRPTRGLGPDRVHRPRVLPPLHQAGMQLRQFGYGIGRERVEGQVGFVVLDGPIDWAVLLERRKIDRPEDAVGMLDAAIQSPGRNTPIVSEAVGQILEKISVGRQPLDHQGAFEEAALRVSARVGMIRIGVVDELDGELPPAVGRDGELGLDEAGESGVRGRRSNRRGKGVPAPCMFGRLLGQAERNFAPNRLGFVPDLTGADPDDERSRRGEGDRARLGQAAEADRARLQSLGAITERR